MLAISLNIKVSNWATCVKGNSDLCTLLGAAIELIVTVVLRGVKMTHQCIWSQRMGLVLVNIVVRNKKCVVIQVVSSTSPTYRNPLPIYSPKII